MPAPLTESLCRYLCFAASSGRSGTTQHLLCTFSIISLAYITNSIAVTNFTNLCLHEGMCVHIFLGVKMGPPGVAGAQ